jgi:hypothetical protein
MFNKFLAKNLIAGKHLPPTAVTLPRPRRTSSVDEGEEELRLHTPTHKDRNSTVKGEKDKTVIRISTAADHQREAAIAHLKDKIGNVPGGTKQAIDRAEE